MAKTINELLEEIVEYATVADNDAGNLEEFIRDGGDPDDHINSKLTELEHLLRVRDTLTRSVLGNIEVFLSVLIEKKIGMTSIGADSLRKELRQLREEYYG